MHHQKSKTLFLVGLFCIVTVIAGSANLQGQTLAGTWTDSQYNIKMILAADGTYTLQYPNGYSRGQYSLNGQTFCMRDASGATPVCYTVVSYTGNGLVLRDANGLMLNYQRQGGSGETKKSPSGGTVLAQKNGYTLSSSHFDAGLGILQFIIGQAVKPSEVQELKTQLIAEFNLNPGEAIWQLELMAKSLQTIRSATDPVRIGLARQELFSALYKATMNFKEEDKPLMIRVMNRYIKVLAYDPANNLLLTNKDAEGLLNYLAFNSELMGQTVNLTPAMRGSIVSDLVKQFNTMPLEQKQILCSASLIWELVDSNWNRLSAAQKQQYKNAYYSQIGQNSQAYRTYNQPANPGSGYNSGSPKSTAEMMSEYRAKQHVFKMMNDMNMNSHALSLNIIENIGGTGNYWKVVDY